MKTLDEVIQEFGNMMPEVCDECPFVCLAKSEDDCPMFIAIHYLKEYRACGQCAYADSYLRCTQETDNPALTWDELLVSIGKPVWVESVIGSGWYLTGGRREDGYIGFIDVKGGVALGRMEDLGKTWQAYRKER